MNHTCKDTCYLDYLVWNDFLRPDNALYPAQIGRHARGHRHVTVPEGVEGDHLVGARDSLLVVAGERSTKSTLQNEQIHK